MTVAWQVKYDTASVAIYCHKHKQDVEWVPDENGDAVTPLDPLNWVCPSLRGEILAIHRRSDEADLAARKELGEQWNAEHPAEVAQYPAGYLKTEGWDYEQYPAYYRGLLSKLDRQEEEAAETCRASWVVILTTKEVNDEHAGD